MKKILIALLSVSIIMCLCACNSGSSSKSEGSSKSETADVSQAPSYIGVWKMTSHNGMSNAPEGYSDAATMELKTDETFVILGTESYEGKTGNSEITGTYTANGSKLSFVAKHISTASPEKSESDLEESFSGEITSDGKMTCLITGYTVNFEKE